MGNGRKKYDVVALGELLMDMTPHGVSGKGRPLFEANPGGAPCNALAIASKLGGRCGFIGKVGKDFFGASLRRTLTEAGIDAAGLAWDETIPTTLAFVHLADNGDRSFSFYRKPGADLMLRKEEVDASMVDSAQIFHFGTLSLAADPARSATRFAVERARRAGCILSFDPNVRLPLWEDRELLLRQLRYGLSVCDVLKLSEEEAALATGEEEPEAALELLSAQYPNLRLIFLTLGGEGSLYKMGGHTGRQAAISSGLPVLDTTGAGDAFFGCCLFLLARGGGLDALTPGSLAQMTAYASAAASLITTRKGSLTVMPGREEIEALLSRRGK